MARSTLQRSYQADRAGLIFGCPNHTNQSITGAGLDSSEHARQISHLPVLALKSAPSTTDHSKTNIVVGIARVVVVTSGRTAIPRIVVPGTAAFSGLPRA